MMLALGCILRTRIQEVEVVVEEVTEDNTAWRFHFRLNTWAPTSGHIVIMN